jgi:hypothetical protein
MEVEVNRGSDGWLRAESGALSTGEAIGTQFEQRGDRASIQTCCFIEEQQTARRDILTAQATGFILYRHAVRTV